MARTFVEFDLGVIEKEWLALRRSSEQDAAKLRYCLERYEESGDENPSPSLIKNFGGGLKELRHINGRFSGRAFFSRQAWSPKESKIQRLWLLHIFRKEGQATPTRSIELAKSRMKTVEGENG